MWPIVICLFTALVVVAERSLWWWRLRGRVSLEALYETYAAVARGDFARSVHLSRQRPQDPYLAVVHQGLTSGPGSLLGAMQLRAMDEVESAERGVWVLGSLITLAPLLGLLGTVTGIMHSFDFVGNEQLAVAKVSGGIAEALIATACGLGIAILCLLPFNFFHRRVASLRSALERTINQIELLVALARTQGCDWEAFARDQASRATGEGGRRDPLTLSPLP